MSSSAPVSLAIFSSASASSTTYSSVAFSSATCSPAPASSATYSLAASVFVTISCSPSAGDSSGKSNSTFSSLMRNSGRGLLPFIKLIIRVIIMLFPSQHL
ncbi:hypothetical protein L3X38_032567 [Prunus dulcis]|uniref:Uncharacterized protein n=1 Tax=Prunus dulcis TaxID=3755 RepID=A0AAD4VED1_PRUDU|nr:hypothetical protein L3X38_032567 [Prunus dulcis]